MNIFKRKNREQATINVRIYKEVRDEIERIADYNMCSITEVVISALKEFIKKHKEIEKRRAK